MKSLQQFILERGAAPMKSIELTVKMEAPKYGSIPNIKGLFLKKEGNNTKFICTNPEAIVAAILMLKYLVAGDDQEIDSMEELEDYLVDNKYDLDELLNNAVAIVGNDKVKEIKKIVERV